MKSWEPLTVQPVYCYTEGRHETPPGTKPLRRETVGLDTTVFFLSFSPSLTFASISFLWFIIGIYESYGHRPAISLFLSPKVHNCSMESIHYMYNIFSWEPYAREFLRIFFPDIAMHCEQKSPTGFAVNHQRKHAWGCFIKIYSNNCYINYMTLIIAITSL